MFFITFHYIVKVKYVIKNIFIIKKHLTDIDTVAYTSSNVKDNTLMNSPVNDVEASLSVLNTDNICTNQKLIRRKRSKRGGKLTKKKGSHPSTKKARTAQTTINESREITIHDTIQDNCSNVINSAINNDLLRCSISENSPIKATPTDIGIIQFCTPTKDTVNNETVSNSNPVNLTKNDTSVDLPIIPNLTTPINDASLVNHKSCNNNVVPLRPLNNNFGWQNSPMSDKVNSCVRNKEHHGVTSQVSIKYVCNH
jgi:hypothetical protein